MPHGKLSEASASKIHGCTLIAFNIPVKNLADDQDRKRRSEEGNEQEAAHGNEGAEQDLPATEFGDEVTIEKCT